MNVASVKISIPDSVGLNTIFKVLVPDNFQGAFFWFICLRPKCFREKEREAEARFLQNLHALDEYHQMSRALSKSARVQEKHKFRIVYSII